MRKSFTFFTLLKILIVCTLLIEFSDNVTAQVSGKVFKDFNANGTFDTGASYNEVGQDGVEVKAYDPSGTLLVVTYTGGGLKTNETGEYNVASASPGQVRLEFVLPDNFTFASKGAAGGTSVMFPTGATQDLAVFYPLEYIGDTNPYLAVPQFINGTYDNATSSTHSGLYSFQYKSSGNVTGGLNLYQPDTIPNIKATIGQMGATWGTAYQRSTKTLYASAVLRRFCGFGPLGSGGIYKIDMTNPTTNSGANNFIDVTQIGIPTGNDPRTGNSCNSLATAVDAPANDTSAANKVGKMGIGGIEYDEQRNTLWFINLFDRKLYGIKNLNPNVIPTAGDVLGGYNITLPSGYNIVNGELRPWAVKVYKGNIYIGAVADGSGEINPWNIANLKGYVLKFDPNNPSAGFSVEYEFSFNYPKASYGTQYLGQWLCWQTDGFNTSSYWGDQPILSDIEFDIDGSLILGILPRGGLQNGSKNNNQVACVSQLDEISASGDILRACKTSSGYVLSGDSGCTTNIPSTVIIDADGDLAAPNNYIYEYYWGEHGPTTTNDAFNESALGALAFLPGSGQVMTTTMDAENFHSGGIITLNNLTGSDNERYNIYYTDQSGSSTTATMAKAIGIGDIEIISNLPTLEIGNRVFMDTDSDGEQDADEMGLDGIKVELWKSGAKVTETTTANGGQWYFTNVDANTAYEVKILSADIPSGKSITTSNTASNAKDLIDNDAVLVGSDAVIAYTTGGAGENNHSLDFGFKNAPTCTLPSAINFTQTAPTCTGATANNNGKITFTSVTNSDKYFINSGATSIGTYASASVIPATGTDLQTAIPNAGGIYTIRFYNGADACYKDTTITIAAVTCSVACSITASISGTNVKCNGGTDGAADLTVSGAAGTPTYSWSNAATSEDLSAVAAGVYSVTVTDGACTATASVTITEPSTLALTCSKVDVITTGGSNGEASVSASGGTSPYTYLWSNGGTTASITGLIAGTYTVTVIDANNCTQVCNSQVNEPGCTQPTIGTNTPSEGTCTGSTPNNDAQIVFTGFTNADKAEKAEAATYTGVAYSGATLTVTGGSLTATGLKHNTQYTFRFWNAVDSCYIDVTVTTPSKNCVTPCPNPNCGTMSVRKL